MNLGGIRFGGQISFDQNLEIDFWQRAMFGRAKCDGAPSRWRTKPSPSKCTVKNLFIDPNWFRLQKYWTHNVLQRKNLIWLQIPIWWAHEHCLFILSNKIKLKNDLLQSNLLPKKIYEKRLYLVEISKDEIHFFFLLINKRSNQA